MRCTVSNNDKNTRHAHEVTARIKVYIPSVSGGWTWQRRGAARNRLVAQDLDDGNAEVGTLLSNTIAFVQPLVGQRAGITRRWANGW